MRRGDALMRNAHLAQAWNFHHGDRKGDARLEARIRAYELAAKMQLSTPEAFDVAGETEAALGCQRAARRASNLADASARTCSLDSLSNNS